MSNRRHICIIVDSLSGGGAEKVAASLSFLLKDNNYRASIISVRDEITYKYAGDLYNLGVNESSIKWIKQLRKTILFRKYYKQINADFYIDFRMRNRFVMELLLHLLVFEPKKTIMSIQHYNIAYHIPKGAIFKKIYSNVKAIVGVSMDIEEKLKSYHPFNNIKHIPNFVYKELLLTSKIPLEEIPNTSVLAIGRLNNAVKQFDQLILSYKKTNAFKQGVKLIILGDGPDRKILEKLIEENNLHSNVKLLGFVKNPYDYIKRCKFLVLCSKYEGMPLVILESLALGTPVVSFDCKSGPSDIINHMKDGLIVEDQNFKSLEKAIDLLHEDETLYCELEKNAKNVTKERFSKETLIKAWEMVFNY